MKINPNAKKVFTDSFWYDLFESKIDPKKLLLEGGQEIADAIELINTFELLLNAESKIDYH